MSPLDVLADLMDYLGSDGSEAELEMCTWQQCAAGYAARQPWFNKLGLRWNKGLIVFGPDNGFAALQRFFEIDERQCDYLFADHPDRTGFPRITTFKEVSRRIRQVQRDEI